MREVALEQLTARYNRETTKPYFFQYVLLDPPTQSRRSLVSTLDSVDGLQVRQVHVQRRHQPGRRRSWGSKVCGGHINSTRISGWKFTPEDNQPTNQPTRHGADR
eukprot:1183521-Prorocentrum_minimum.AAC.2